MRHRSQTTLEPRKSPLQARSTASVDALLQAAIQVLLRVGKEELTTTKVAIRAGVSIGTLYQYFPNKRALLQAALRRHLSEVAANVELACRQQEGKTHGEMLDALITTFLRTKMRDPKTSTALYSISTDIDGAKIAREMGLRLRQAIARMLASSSEVLSTEPEIAAFLLQGAMTGVSRSLLEASEPREQTETVRRELIRLGRAYLRAPAAAVCDSVPSLETTDRF